MAKKYIILAKSGRYEMSGEYELKEAKAIFSSQKGEDCFVFFSGSEPKYLEYIELEQMNRFGVVQGFVQFAMLIDRIVDSVISRKRLKK